MKDVWGDMAEILTTKEAADFLKLHEKTLSRLARQGKLPGNKIGGEWRFLKEDLVGWIHSGPEGGGHGMFQLEA